ncbi:hypothetical protein [Eggerthella sinensis]|uniref:hypothetical protein n=1 Tax=Eggerthella sinensis TaxID=242230 RepID=UPI001D0805BE|nr:hypothetical protein [Eggerthella sinensis]MCB7036561.1 hypothetical protein [Eggerthella sinensis]
MSDAEEIRSELSGHTNFDEEHEGELFERVAKIEQAEREGTLVAALNKTDNVLIAAMFVVLGVLPVLWYAVMYF